MNETIYHAWLLGILMSSAPTVSRAFSTLSQAIPSIKTQRRGRVASTHDELTSFTSLAAYPNRRNMIATAFASVAICPTLAEAGIDVSGLPVQGTAPNADLASQLKKPQYNDGSVASQLKQSQYNDASAASRVQTGTQSVSSTTGQVAPPPVGVATWALRATEPVFGKLNFGTSSRYQGRIIGPSSSRSSYSINFDFPADWLQLDKFNGCIQFVDQRNGDKVYVLRVTLPPDTTLATIPKQFFAKALFDPEGSLVRSGGLTVEDARASKDVTPLDCPGANACGRRLLLKFATVTGNGLRVERRGLLQAYTAPGDTNDVYMMFTSSNAVKFEKGGIERDTVENIVNSFRIEFV